MNRCYTGIFKVFEVFTLETAKTERLLKLKEQKFFETILKWKFDPFEASVPFLYPLETSENQRFSDVFRRYRKGTLA